MYSPISELQHPTNQKNWKNRKILFCMWEHQWLQEFLPKLFYILIVFCMVSWLGKGWKKWDMVRGLASENKYFLYFPLLFREGLKKWNFPLLDLDPPLVVKKNKVKFFWNKCTSPLKISLFLDPSLSVIIIF